MHKILRIIYGMLKHRCKYDPRIDQANRAKKFVQKEGRNKIKQNKSRRYQTYDPDAPVSQRQAKRRKEYGGLKKNPKGEGKNEKIESENESRKNQ